MNGIVEKIQKKFKSAINKGKRNIKTSKFKKIKFTDVIRLGHKVERIWAGIFPKLGILTLVLWN